MTKPRVYVETSIPSFYHEKRSAPDIVARREWTRRWWDTAPENYELLTSFCACVSNPAGTLRRDR